MVVVGITRGGSGGGGGDFLPDVDVEIYVEAAAGGQERGAEGL